MRARGGTRTALQPLNIRHSPENLRNPARSGTSTTRSEGTLSLPALGAPNHAA